MMYLAAAKPDLFYRTSADDLWGDGIRPSMMTTAQLAGEMRKGMTTYRALYPPKNTGLFGTPVGWMMLAAVGVGAVAIATGGVAAGAGVASAASTAGTAATGVTTTAATTGLTAAKSLVAAQKIAAGLKIAGKVGSVAGVELPDQLMRAADFVANPKGVAAKLAFDAAMNELQGSHNLTLDAKGQDALREQIQREQQRQAALLRSRAAQLQQAGHKSTAIDWWKVAPLLIPFVILLIQKKA